MRRLFWLVRTCSLALVLACRGDNLLAPTAPSLVIVSGGGDAQTGTVGTTLPLPLVVQVTGVSGSTNGQILNFVVTSGGGSVFASVVQTGSPTSGPGTGLSGVGQNKWTLGATAGPQTVEARLIDAKTGATLTQATFRATAVAATASLVKMAAGDNQAATAGTAVAVAPAVLVTDQLGNPRANVTVTFQVASGGGAINGPNQVATGANGVATLGGWVLGGPVGANTLSASSTGLTGSPLTFTATGTPGAATSLAAVAGDTQRAEIGTGVAVAPTVKALDANGNGVGGVAVTFTVMSGGGTMAGITSVTTLTNQTGVASVGWAVGAAAGPNALRATALGLSGNPVTFNSFGYTPLFVSNQNANTITVYDPELGGNTPHIRTIGGLNTTLNQPCTMTRDALGQLYVTNLGGAAVLIFAPGANGNVAPIRTISGPNTGLTRPYGLTRDGAGQIYVFDADSRAINVFAPDASGNATPIRTISGGNTGLVSVGVLLVSSTGELYAADDDGGNVKVYAAGASGNVAPARVIAGPSTGLVVPRALALDEAGRLYVGDFRAQSISLFSAGASGDVTPIRVISGTSTGISNPTGVAFDALGKMYVSNYTGQAITVYAPGASGNVAPSRTISGPSTGFNFPLGLTF